MRPAGSDRGHPPSVLREVASTDGVDASPDRMEPAVGDAALDRLPREPQGQELRTSYDPVLALRESPGPPSNRLIDLTPYRGYKASACELRPPHCPRQPVAPLETRALSLPARAKRRLVLVLAEERDHCAGVVAEVRWDEVVRL